jgi:L-fuconolactonase
VAAEFVSMFPEQSFVLDHIAKPDIKNGDVSPWREGIEKLADFDNVYCKLSGMVTEADWQSWIYEDFVPYLDTVFDAFGEDRLMIGSDWPVCTLAGNYTRVMGIISRYLEHKGENMTKKILGQNAIEFYHLKL